VADVARANTPAVNLSAAVSFRPTHLKSGGAWVEVQVRLRRSRQFKMTEPNDNQILTKLDYLESRAFGACVLACGPAGSVGVDP
jgi:hypothetical protein